MVDYPSQRKKLIERLKREGIIRTKEVERAMLKVPREEFVPSELRDEAYTDSPLNLGESGQTISAPHMVAIMLEELQLSKNQLVLEIGTGSGYNSALISEIVHKDSETTSTPVISIERLPELASFAIENLRRTGYVQNVKVVVGDGILGYPAKSEKETYDRIVVTAAAFTVPDFLKKQLKVGGIILIPIGDFGGQNLVKGMKTEPDKLLQRVVCGCMFVPLVPEMNSLR
jgi:protein-L-isoaspartate(D-aspartate) O-methyltransferase